MGRVEKTVFFAATPVVLYVNFESFLSMTKTIKTFLVENCHFGDSNMQQITINEFELWRFTRSVVGHWNIHHVITQIPSKAAEGSRS